MMAFRLPPIVGSVPASTPLLRRLLFALTAVVPLFLAVFLLFGTWSFLQFEEDRLGEPVGARQLVPRLKRDELVRFVRALTTPPPPPPARPSPSPRGRTAPPVPVP